MAKELNATSLISDANLQGYWRGESNLNDSGPNGYNLNNFNSVGFGAALFGNGPNNLNAARMGYLATVPNLQITGSQSWVGWLNVSSLNASNILLALNSNSILSSGLKVDTNGAAYFILHGLTTNTQVVSANGLITTGAWFHLAGVYDASGQTLKIYINGVQQGSVSASGNHSDPATFNGFTWGADFNAANGLVGSSDDAAVFNRVLTPTEISLLGGPNPSSGFFFAAAR